MDGNEFVNKLKAENEAILAKIDEPPISSGIPKSELLATLVKMALKNEIEATEIAAEWVSTTPEIHAKLTHEGGTVARLVRQRPDDGSLVDELYLTFYSRLPDEGERALAVEYLRKDSGH